MAGERFGCHTCASGFCVEVLPADICEVSVVGNYGLMPVERALRTECVLTCVSGYHVGGGCQGFAVGYVQYRWRELECGVWR
jgi:hypothetical protein